MKINDILNNGLVVYSTILRRKDINDTSKILLSIIIEDCKKNKTCNLTNNEFGVLLHRVSRSVSRHVGTLKELGYIDTKDGFYKQENDHEIYFTPCREITLTEKTEKLLKGGN